VAVVEQEDIREQEVMGRRRNVLLARQVQVAVAAAVAAYRMLLSILAQALA
jgi:hypothetical protein